MKKEKSYQWTRYKPEVIKEAFDTLATYTDAEHKKVSLSLLTTTFPDERWTHNTFEEFSADLRRSPSNFVFLMGFGSHTLQVFQFGDRCEIAVEAPNRLAIESTFEIFESHVASSRVEQPELVVNPPTIFVGHGRSQQWRDLKDHLHEQHGYPVEAYEVGARAGHTIRDILESMMDESSFAILVLTGEDESKDGKLHPRLNVVHELGLFQGTLGFSKAIALLEDGTEEFSNIHGIQQIRYSKNNIRETFGDVLATIRREFNEEAA